MARRFYTVFILPHAQERFRKLHVSRNFVLATGAVLLLVGLAGALAPHLFFRVLAQSSHLAALEVENRRLHEEKGRVETSLSHLGVKLNAVEATAARLATALGVAESVPTRAAGGSTPAPTSLAAGSLLDEEFGALGQRTATLERSLEALDQAFEARKVALASTPSLWPVTGSFSDRYGWRQDPFTGEREFHRGVDIVAPLGTSVYATADGLVTGAGRMSGYGKMVHLAHGYGHGTRYGHLSEILVQPGQRVKRGDVIGRVGSTGRSSGPHLHYEVFRGGAPVDPRRYLGTTVR